MARFQFKATWEKLATTTISSIRRSVSSKSDEDIIRNNSNTANGKKETYDENEVNSMSTQDINFNFNLFPTFKKLYCFLNGNKDVIDTWKRYTSEI